MAEFNFMVQEPSGIMLRSSARSLSASERMYRLLDELLDLSRIGRVVGRMEDVRLGELAEEAGAQLAEQLRARGVDPRRVAAWAARSAGRLQAEPATPRELLAGFDLTDVPRGPTPLTPQDLAELQGH